MNVKLTPEQEEFVQGQLKSGRFRTTEEVIAEAPEVLRENAGHRP